MMISNLVSLLPLVRQPGGSNHALVPLCGLLLRGLIPRERPAPSGQWDVGACLPEPLRITTRGRFVLLDGQCSVGPLQSCCWLRARLSCRQLRSAQDPACAGARGGHPASVAHSCPHIRTVPRGAVSLLRSLVSPRDPTDGVISHHPSHLVSALTGSYVGGGS